MPGNDPFQSMDDHRTPSEQFKHDRLERDGIDDTKYPAQVDRAAVDVLRGLAVGQTDDSTDIGGTIDRYNFDEATGKFYVDGLTAIAGEGSTLAGNLEEYDETRLGKLAFQLNGLRHTLRTTGGSMDIDRALEALLEKTAAEAIGESVKSGGNEGAGLRALRNTDSVSDLTARLFSDPRVDAYAQALVSQLPQSTAPREELIDKLDEARMTTPLWDHQREALERWHTNTQRGYVDMATATGKTVDLLTGDVGDEVADRWEYVFCDEFQDTDRLQFELVTSLVSDDRLFVVGDDDQAIYEWRGARVANITTELTDEFRPSLTDKPLEENFRSRQPILDLANDLLTRLEGRTDGKTLTRIDEPDYDGDTVAVIDEAEEDDDRAQQLVTVTQNLLTGAANELDKTYDPGDIAVLVRKNDHAAPLLDAFDRAGIPYQVAGDLATESIGVGTIVAYLKALARPEGDEVSWNRVLTMRYRLTDADLRRLNDHDDDEGSLIEELCEAPLTEFEEPERVREARRHATQLLEIRDRASLSHLYSELKDVTNIEWYLSEQERRDLEQLDEVIDQYGHTAVQPPLTSEFIESLQHYESLFAESGSSPTDQPELADDAVNVMTVHKSKGLDFPVVLMPRLTADEWEPGSRTYDTLEAGLSDGPAAAFDEDFIARDAAETRRVLHVGVTRAEDILVLQGSHDDEDDNGDDDSSDTHPIATAVDDLLPARVPWRPERNHLPIWQDIHDCLPSEASDWTDTLASEQIGQVGGTVQYQDDDLSPTAARDRVLEFASSSVNGRLPPTGERLTIQVESLTGPTTPTPALSHSYTSLQSYEECPRQHYLDYVVNAYPDYRATGEDDSGGISQRDIGLLFHDTAEQAANEGTVERADWYEICERLASQRRADDALEPAKQCIDRYFELKLSAYDIIDAEREFELDIDGHELIGFIDAVYRTPDDELLVIDYKSTERHRDLGTDKQLPIYLLACRDLYDEPVRQAGYAYVGDIGPTIETRTFSETELQAVKDDVTTAMNRIVEFSFSEYSAGDHCRWCQHNQLPCAPDSLQID